MQYKAETLLLLLLWSTYIIHGLTQIKTVNKCCAQLFERVNFSILQEFAEVDTFYINSNLNAANISCKEIIVNNSLEYDSNSIFNISKLLFIYKKFNQNI